MVLILYGFVVFLATLLGSFVGLGGGVIIKPVLDVINAHSLTEISFFSSCAVFAMSITSTTRHIIKKTPIKPSIVLLVALGSVCGFGLVICAVSALRELAISGTLWDKPMGFDLRLPEAAQPFAAFILLGFMAAFLQWIKAGVSHFFQRKEEESR